MLGKMAAKIAVFLSALLVGSLALPALEQNEQDMSMFFDQADPEARIVGGTEAQAGSHPHMVALTNGLAIRSLVCGGSLLTPRTVLTAAHCIAAVFSWGSLSNNLRVTVGTNRWNSGGQSFSVSRNVTHQHYVSATIKNDIGVLIVSSAINLTPLINTITPTYESIGGGVIARVAGWGRIRANGALSATLLEVTLPTIGGQECVDAVARASVELNVRAPPIEPHIEICTFHAPGFGTCNGDSGSALWRLSDGRQIGIVSWGFPCARGAPDVFVRISGFQDWLAQHVV